MTPTPMDFDPDDTGGAVPVFRRPLRPVFQTIIDTVRGDCERACVATILGLPIEDVPNFVAPETPWDDQLRSWIRRQGHGLIELKGEHGLRDYVYSGLLHLVAIATVPSQAFEGGRHAIVVGWRPDPEYPEDAFECFVVHDPNPNNAPYTDLRNEVLRLRWIVPHVLQDSR